MTPGESAAHCLTCARCEHVNPPDSKFCRSCGGALDERLAGREGHVGSQPSSTPGEAPARAAASSGNGLRTAAIAVAAVLALAVVAGVAIVLTRSGHSRSAAQGASVTTSNLHPHASGQSTSVASGSHASAGKVGGDQASATVKEGSSVTTSTLTTSTTSASAGGARAASSGAGTSAAPSGGPSATIRDHLEDLEDGRYQAAFGLMTAAYRDQNPTWPTVRAEADPTIRIVSVDAPGYRGGVAYVYVDFYAQDAYPTPGSDTDCRQFTGTVEIVKRGDLWEYDPYGDHLTSTLQPNTDCRS